MRRSLLVCSVVSLLAAGSMVSPVRATGTPAVRTWSLQAGAPGEQYVRIENPTPDPITFELTLNGEGYRDVQALVAAILSMPPEFAGEPDYRKAWRLVRDRIYTSMSITPHMWLHTPTLLLNSVGFGLCDDYAQTLVYLWQQLGYDARVWSLEGHVVSEVLGNGFWHMFDADYGIYYFDAALRVASVNQLQDDPSLITSPIAPIAERTSDVYAPGFADLYATTSDNVALPYSGFGDPLVFSFTLPPGSTLDLPGVFEPTLRSPIDGSPTPWWSNTRLTVPAGWTGTIATPLVVHTVRGDASVEVGSGTVSRTGSVPLVTELPDRPFDPNVAIAASDSPVQIIYLLNPALFALHAGSNELKLTGSGVDALKVSVTDDDRDHDGMPTSWEEAFGLNPSNPNDAYMDDNGNGLTNLQEYLQDRHPKGRSEFARYLAEGSAGFFSTTIALANASATATATALLRFLRDDGRVFTSLQTVAPHSRATFSSDAFKALAGHAFSTVVESDAQLVVDRTMSWEHNAGSHAESALTQPATTWYLAEGATTGNFDLFYLIQNPNGGAARVTVTFLLPAPAPPLIEHYTVAAQSRFNIWVDTIDALSDAEVSAIITSDVPIIVERAMYLSGATQFEAGSESAGVTAPAPTWFLAEGATGPYFDLFVLLANPNTTPARVRATYLLPSGPPLVAEYVVPARSRFTIWVDEETFGGRAPLADTAVSVRLDSTNGVSFVAERAMWWPGSPETWIESHTSTGATSTGVRWAFAGGEVGGPDASETYILLANMASSLNSVRVTLLFENGRTAERVYSVGPQARFNVSVGDEFVEAANRRFGAIVESLNGAPLVVERSCYASPDGVRWRSGSNLVATRLTN